MIMESTNEKTLFEVAEIQLTYKSKVKPSLRPKITGSKDVYEVLKKYWDENKIEFVEQFKIFSSTGPTRLSVSMKFHPALQQVLLLILNLSSSRL